jgi:hypothetical protein
MKRNIIQKKPFYFVGEESRKIERVSFNEGDFPEKWMQKILQENPTILPISDIDQNFGPLLCIGKEFATKSGKIDLLFISRDGYITIVETKLWRNPGARRDAVSQIIDYAKDLRDFSYEELDKRVKIYRRLNYGDELGLFDIMLSNGLLGKEDESLFVDYVQKNLENARFLLLIVGDGIREGVSKMVEFLNQTPNMMYKLGLVELEVYKIDGSEHERIIIPNLLMKTNIVQRGVFALDQGKILYTETNNEDIDTIIESNNITLDEFARLVSTKKPFMTEKLIVDFLNDLDELGYIISPYQKSNLKIRLPIPGSKLKLDVIFLSSEDGIAYKNRGTLEADLERFGYPRDLAKEFYNLMKPYQYDNNEKGRVLHHFERIIRDSDSVISIFERFKNRF